MAFDAATRTTELEELYLSEDGGWRAIKAIADPLGVSKPESGWDDAIPLIVKAEQTAASNSDPPEEDSTPSVTAPDATPWRKVRTDLYGNIIPNPWSS